MGYDRKANPPEVCRVLSLDCLTCPIACCLEEIMPEGQEGGHSIVQLWYSVWPRARLRREPRRDVLKALNSWLYDEVLPLARQVIEGKATVMPKARARVVIETLMEGPHDHNYSRARQT
jgi:hypothetical protein